MIDVISWMEQMLITIGLLLFRTIFFFLEDSYQSFMVSIVHYAIFIIGFYYFMYHSNPRSTYRIVFFLFVLGSTICYYLFNKCILTQIEMSLSKDQNAIQKTMEYYFGNKIEGNESSKIVLSSLTLLTGLLLGKEYGLF
jgi:thiol:disulfide interchange protein